MEIPFGLTSRMGFKLSSQKGLGTYLAMGVGPLLSVTVEACGGIQEMDGWNVLVGWYLLVAIARDAFGDFDCLHSFIYPLH